MILRQKVIAKLNSALFKDSFIYIIGALFLKGTSFFLIPLYTSTFSTYQYGVIEFVNTITSFIAILFSLGFPQLSYTKYFHFQDKEQRTEFINELIDTYIVIITPLSILLLFFSFNMVDRSELPLNRILIGMLSILTIYFTFFQNLFYNILQLERKSLRVTINKVIVGLLIFSGNYFLIAILKAGILSIFISNLVSVGISIVLLRKSSIPSRYFSFLRPGLIKNFIAKGLNNTKMGFPFILTSLSYFGLVGVDRFIIKFLLGNESLGVYSLAYKFASIYEPLLIAPILTAYTPHLFKRFSNGDYTQNNKWLITGTLVGIVVLSFITVIVARYIINPKFYESLYLIPFLIAGLGFSFLAQAIAAPILYQQKIKILLINILIAGVINILLNLYLAKLWGVKGVALAYIFSNFFWCLLTQLQAISVKRKIINNAD